MYLFTCELSSWQNGVLSGRLKDVTGMASEAGIKIPVAFTAAAWQKHVAVTPEMEAAGQSESGRLWDILFVLRHAAGRSKGSDLRFMFSAVQPDDPRGPARRQTLCAKVRPGDDEEPVMTISLPEEEAQEACFDS